MTDVTQHGAIIRWEEDSLVSEPFQLLDNTLASFQFPTANAPAVPFIFQGDVNRDGVFWADIEDDNLALVAFSPNLDRWHTPATLAAFFAPFSQLRFRSSVGPAADYEIRMVSKRGGTGAVAAAGGGP